MDRLAGGVEVAGAAATIRLERIDPQASQLVFDLDTSSVRMLG
jgi:hypothetical protein